MERPTHTVRGLSRAPRNWPTSVLAAAVSCLSIACGSTEPVGLDGPPAPPPPPPPPPPAASAQIVFDSDRDGDFEIFTMNADGSDQTQITFDGARNSKPSWSPDGTMIVFMTNRDGQNEIYSMGADGSNPTRLTNTAELDSDPRYSPDGSQILFSRAVAVGNASNFEVLVMNADGSDVRNLTNDSSQDLAGSWSPDGTQILFSSDRATPGAAMALWVMDADGSNPMRLTTPVAPEQHFEARWSPDGGSLVFFSNRGGAQGVYVANSDGSGATMVTATVVIAHPVWSPDSGMIAFSCTGAGTDICTMNADGSGRVTIAGGAGEDVRPDWR